MSLRHPHVSFLTLPRTLPQDLMELFTKYDIPSDLLAYDGRIDKDSSEKIAAVKGHVQGMHDMIASIKVFRICSTYLHYPNP